MYYGRIVHHQGLFERWCENTLLCKWPALTGSAWTIACKCYGVSFGVWFPKIGYNDTRRDIWDMAANETEWGVIRKRDDIQTNQICQHTIALHKTWS